MQVINSVVSGSLLVTELSSECECVNTNEIECFIEVSRWRTPPGN